MRLTQALRQQHIGQWFKSLWYHRRNIAVQDMKADAALAEKGVAIEDAFKLLYPELPHFIKVKTIKPALLPPPKVCEIIGETHPMWNTQKCHIFGDTNVLVLGVPQAQLLTKTVCVDGLPEKLQATIDGLEVSRETNTSMKDNIVAAHLFDAQQEKLEKLKDPTRPAWNFPRVHGITRQRKNQLIVAKLVNISERLGGLALSTKRKQFANAVCVVPFEKDGNLYQFEITAETLLTSKQQIAPIAESSSHAFKELPDIFPMQCNISIPAGHLYNLRNIYPIAPGYAFGNAHTIFLHFTQDVQNLHETPVTQTQFESRAMLKAFAVAAASAQSKYGIDVKQLPEPITVQSIQIDRNVFLFGVFQLNTLDLNGTDGLKNIWYSVPQKKFYEHCGYDEGRPHLVDYNSDVLRHVIGFYNNQ